MIDFLKYINSIPLPFTIKHYEEFGNLDVSLKDNELNSPESWDVLRETHTHFSVANNREEWLKASEVLIKKDGQDGGLKKRAKDIVNLIEKNKIQQIFSVGVGGGGLEYQIKKIIPQIKMICSEYSKSNINLLKNVFVECDKIIFFDVKKSDWRISTDDVGAEKLLCLLYRVDPHLTDLEWKIVFSKMSDSGIKNILFIPCSLLTMKSVINRFLRRLKWLIKGRKYSFSGYLRTRKRFISFWNDLYNHKEYDFGGLNGFLLNKKD